MIPPPIYAAESGITTASCEGRKTGGGMIPPLVPIALAFLAGILLAWHLTILPSVCLGLGLVSVLASSFCCRKSWVSFLALLLLWISLGALRTAIWQHQPAPHVARLLTQEPAPILLHGLVVDDPVELFAPGEPERQVAVIQARHVRIDDAWRAATGLIRARLKEPRFKLAYGDEALIEGRWSVVPPPTNPGQYDWRAALERQRIHALLSVEPYHGVVRIRSGQGHWWFRSIYALRHRLEHLIDTHFSPHHAGLLRSIVLGQRVALDENLKQAFIETGTMHLLVISGFNVGLIAVLLELFLRIVGFPLRLRLALSASGLFVYCFLTGMQAPVTRATVMAWTVLGALWLDRTINWPNTLAAAALAILWVNPAQLFDPGFQLSFGAVISLFVFTAKIRAFLELCLRIRPQRLGRYIAISLATTCAIWAGLWPLLAWYFHLVSPVSVLANLLLVPLVSVMVGAGTVLLMVGAVASSVVQWSRVGLEFLLDLIVGCVRWCHHIPMGFWPVAHPPWVLICGYYVLVLLVLMRRRLRLAHGWLIALWLAGLNVWLWGGHGARIMASGWLEVTVLDVGHGDSVVIRTPSQHTFLVDSGTQEAGRYALTPFLRFKGFHAVDALILSHPDEDHLGGALGLFREMRVKRLMTNGSEGSTLAARQLLDFVRTARPNYARLVAGMRLAGPLGIQVSVLHPPPGFVPNTLPSSNDNSVVLKLTKGDVSLLLCGDLEEDGIPWILRWGDAIRSTVLLVPHHGSALGPEGKSFFERVRPAVAVISVGRLHDLPSTEVLQGLSAVGARVFLTRQEGAIALRTDGVRLEMRTFKHSGQWQPVSFEH